MRGAAWRRFLTPMGWLMVGLILLVLVVALSKGLGLSWDPLGLKARRIDRLEQAAQQGRAEALARELETAARRQQREHQARDEAHLRQIAEATSQTIQEARRAEDANTPLDQARLDRLHRHDRQLCTRPDGRSGCAAAP